MPPKKKKGKGPSKEELERIQREKEEQERLQALMELEKEAEARQAEENRLRDEAEAKEQKRLRKEAQLRLMQEKDDTIETLSTELSVLQSSFSAERNELQEELHSMLQLKESLLNRMSVQQAENEEIQRGLLEERAVMSQQLQIETRKLKETEEELKAKTDGLDSAEQQLDTKVGRLSKELNQAKADLETHQRENRSHTHNLELQLEKVTALNKALQEVIEAREVDDRKNVTLMQLLNNQLDDNKRRSQEVLDEERANTKQARKDLALAQEEIQSLNQECDMLKREKDQIKKQSEADLHDYKAKLDQLKFDMKYLHSELHSYKTQLAKQKEEALSAKTDSAAAAENAQVAYEAERKKAEELESLMRRKDREHFDKVTFLNAQISNNRTIISQLQQKMNKEREERQVETRNANVNLEEKANTVNALADDLEKRKTAAVEVEMQLNADVAILKTTVFQLQSALVEKEREFDTINSAKDEELRRLRLKLDDAFIQHRNEIPPSEGSLGDGAETEKILNEKVAKLTHDLEITQRAAIDSETKLKAQLSNQTHIIDSLQAEMLKLKEEAGEREKIQNAEIQRLRQLLDVNYIPHAK